MRKIRFRYIKENGKATSVTVRCSLKRKLVYHRLNLEEMIDTIESSERERPLRDFVCNIR